MINFRNYTPQTRLLEGSYTVEKAEPESIIPYIQDKLDLLNDNRSESSDKNPYKLDIKILEPKKVDWDLKRRIEKKMERLDRETRKNIDIYIKNKKNKSR